MVLNVITLAFSFLKKGRFNLQSPVIIKMPALGWEVPQDFGSGDQEEGV